MSSQPPTGKTRADFKALRETLGITHPWLADQLTMNVRNTHRWEADTTNSWYQPPDKAWNLLYNLKKDHDKYIHQTVKQATIHHKIGDTITLTYYHKNNQSHLDLPRDIINARIRAAGTILEHLGYTVTYQYPDHT
ncbi:hypothetical protein EJ419_06265 [Alloscardovia theropitheci]|uniref:Uncharacterized protein n=1 Tax=Alloscardovia theropitheci TaxID=2496842 RepID=A0A4R0QNS8_9BIFI|nr:hypothetical protein [Alloscardovia theropitheci]TCD53853.1 hypothetical protein EJ419_06265 [Alloscardovia theropitheci]